MHLTVVLPQDDKESLINNLEIITSFHGISSLHTIKKVLKVEFLSQTDPEKELEEKGFLDLGEIVINDKKAVYNPDSIVWIESRLRYKYSQWPLEVESDSYWYVNSREDIELPKLKEIIERNLKPTVIVFHDHSKLAFNYFLPEAFSAEEPYKRKMRWELSPYERYKAMKKIENEHWQYLLEVEKKREEEEKKKEEEIKAQEKPDKKGFFYRLFSRK